MPSIYPTKEEGWWVGGQTKDVVLRTDGRKDMPLTTPGNRFDRLSKAVHRLFSL